VRGAGADGLSALNWISDVHLCAGDFDAEADNERIKVARPLLSVSRRDTAESCQVCDVRARKDQYDLDSRFAHCRTWKHVLPHLRAYYNGQVEEASVRTAHSLQGQFDALEPSAADVFALHSARQRPGFRGMLSRSVHRRCGAAAVSHCLAAASLGTRAGRPGTRDP
jgi:tRNA(Ile)-lysidine synthase